MSRKRKPPRVTVTFLRRHKACDSEIAAFAEVFPRGAEVTRENIVLARERNLYVNWLPRCLPPAAKDEYFRIRSEASIPCDRAYYSSDPRKYSAALVTYNTTCMEALARLWASADWTTQSRS